MGILNIKKLIFISLFLALVVSGCSISSKQSTMTEKNAPESSVNYNEGGIMTRINELRAGRAPIVKPSGKTAPPLETPPEQESAKTPKRIQLEDLARDYNQAIIKTNFGNIKVEFYANESPVTVNNFLNLAKQELYNGTLFHRVIKDFMIQGGDPLSKDEDWSNDGTGGPGYMFRDEINSHQLVEGSLAMANSGPDTNGSQFFIITALSTPWLDGKHTNFGYVVEGMDVVDEIKVVETNKNDRPLEDVIIERVELIKK